MKTLSPRPAHSYFVPPRTLATMPQRFLPSREDSAPTRELVRSSADSFNMPAFRWRDRGTRPHWFDRYASLQSKPARSGRKNRVVQPWNGRRHAATSAHGCALRYLPACVWVSVCDHGGGSPSRMFSTSLERVPNQPCRRFANLSSGCGMERSRKHPSTTGSQKGLGGGPTLVKSRLLTLISSPF